MALAVVDFRTAAFSIGVAESAVATYCAWIAWSAAGKLRPATRGVIACFGLIREADHPDFR